MHKTSAWPLALIHAALIVFASLFPFDGWRDQGIDPWIFLSAPLPPPYWTGFDVATNVVGYALAPPTQPSLFEEARVAEGMTSVIGDIRDLAALQAVFAEHRPEIVFHMAAQPLVRYSYAEPVETYATNVMGTAHVLDAVRPL